MRNVLNLNKKQIDRNRYVAWYHPDETKSGQALGVALNDTAMAIINQHWLDHPHRIFVNSHGLPLNDIDRRVWAAALEKAEISDFRWHDLRHTWASWLVQHGVPIRVVQEMGGWKTLAMVQRYAYLAPDHLHEHANVLSRVVNFDTNWAQQKGKEIMMIA